eukprot:gene11469-biopygen12413
MPSTPSSLHPSICGVCSYAYSASTSIVQLPQKGNLRCAQKTLCARILCAPPVLPRPRRNVRHHAACVRARMLRTTSIALFGNMYVMCEWTMASLGLGSQDPSSVHCMPVRHPPKCTGNTHPTAVAGPMHLLANSSTSDSAPNSSAYRGAQ